MESQEKYNQLDAEIQHLLKTIKIKLEKHKGLTVMRPTFLYVIRPLKLIYY
jgi:hypothetical protein